MQHGRSKGWEDCVDAKNRKRPSFTAGLCYQKNSVSAADPPKQDVGCPPRDFGITLFTRSPPHRGHENADCISLAEPAPAREDKVGERARARPSQTRVRSNEAAERSGLRDPASAGGRSASTSTGLMSQTPRR